MGFFDFLTGKKATANEPAGLSPWQAHVRQVEAQKGFRWDYRNETARAVVRQLFEQAAPGFGNAVMKELPSDAIPEAGSIELQGTYDGAATVSPCPCWIRVSGPPR